MVSKLGPFKTEEELKEELDKFLHEEGDFLWILDYVYDDRWEMTFETDFETLNGNSLYRIDLEQLPTIPSMPWNIFGPVQWYQQVPIDYLIEKYPKAIKVIHVRTREDMEW